MIEMSERVAPKLETGGYSETAIVAIIRDRIVTGAYAPGERLPAERVLAAEFGVSRSVVRTAYARLTEQGLIEQSHYRRPFVSFTGSRPIETMNGSGQIAGGRATNTIAAILPSDPVFAGGLSIVAGIHKTLAETESPYRLTFLDTYHKDRPEVLRREQKAVTSVLSDNAAGLMYWYFSPEDYILEILEQNPNLPLVFLDRHPQDIDCDFVGLDDVESSRIAVEYLIDLNHKRIAHIMDPGDFTTILERAQGYREAHIARGLALDDSLTFHLDWSHDASLVTNTEQAFQHLFGLKNPPTAIFTSNDYIALRFLKVAQAHGMRVPEDISIVGHGNMERWTPHDAFLTTVDQPFDLIGRTAAKLLLKRLESSRRSSTYQQIILPAPLIVRQSARALP